MTGEHIVRRTFPGERSECYVGVAPDREKEGHAPEFTFKCERRVTGLKLLNASRAVVVCSKA